MNSMEDCPRVSRWYFGGLAAAGATCFTHPIDLIKVNLQTHQGKLSILPLAAKIIRNQGFFALYNGLSASLLRQLTYSTTRFGVYEVGKQYIETQTLGGKVALSSVAGFIGGLIGTPCDLVNVRMQNDVKLPREKRRNYKHAIDGLFRVYKYEGFTELFSGVTAATTRGVLMTVGQIAFYEQAKEFLLTLPEFGDNLTLHFTASLFAGAVATTVTQPLDVIKTRMMNARRGEFNGIWDVIKYTSHLGPLGFYKGFIPAFMRVEPQTILTFIFLEQLRMNFGDKMVNC